MFGTFILQNNFGRLCLDYFASRLVHYWNVGLTVGLDISILKILKPLFSENYLENLTFNAEISHTKPAWLLFFTLLSHLCKISWPDLVPVPNYWTWTKPTPQKKCFFWSNRYKTEVLITSQIAMLVLPNFGFITKIYNIIRATW